MWTNKKILLLFFVLLFNQLTAQKVYFSAGAGPGFGFAKQSYQSFFDIEVNGETETKESAVPMSFGKGLNSFLRLGYRLNNNIDFSIEAGYLEGGRTSVLKEQVYQGPNNEPLISTQKTELFGNMWSIRPAILLSPIQGRFSPFIRLGPSINFTETFSVLNFKGSNSLDITEEFIGDFTFGFSSDVGFKYLINENWELFAEMRFQSFSFQPSQSKYTEYKVDGVNKLEDLQTFQKETVYREKISDPVGQNGFTGNDDPLQKLIFKQPFSSVQILIGISYNL